MCNDLSIIIYVTQLSPVVSGIRLIQLKFSSFDIAYPDLIFPLFAIGLSLGTNYLVQLCVAVGPGCTNLVLLFDHILKSTSCQINLRRQPACCNVIQAHDTV